MRKFIATCCCLIVGLQVLIGVPLVICVVFFAYASAASGPVFVTSAAPPSDYPVYSAAPPVAPPKVSMPDVLPPVPYSPSSSAPSPSPLPSPAFEPPQKPRSSAGQPVYSPPTQPLPMPFASPAPTLSLSPAPAIEPASVEIEDKQIKDKQLEPAAVAEIVATREKMGSPLEGTLLEHPVHPAEETAFVNALTEGESEQASEPAEAEASEPTVYEMTNLDGSTSIIRSKIKRPATEPLLETLALAMKQLYAHADWHEQGYSWDRADEIREFARSLVRQRALIESERPRQNAYSDEAAAGYLAPVGESEPAEEPAYEAPAASE